MPTEDFIREVAKDISRRLLESKAESSGSQTAQAHECECKKEKIVAEAPQSAVRNPQSVDPAHLTILSLQPIQHPSQQRFKAGDALNEFIEFLQHNKQCTMEKNKPCDNCDICNTLGF